MLGADVVVVEQARFFLRQHHHSSSPVGEPLEHRVVLPGVGFGMKGRVATSLSLPVRRRLPPSTTTHARLSTACTHYRSHCMQATRVYVRTWMCGCVASGTARGMADLPTIGVPFILDGAPARDPASHDGGSRSNRAGTPARRWHRRRFPHRYREPSDQGRRQARAPRVHHGCSRRP